MSDSASAASDRGDDKLIFGSVLAVVTFWLFAQTTLNIAPVIRDDLQITGSVTNIAVSITALFSGIFIVIAGGVAETASTSAGAVLCFVIRLIAIRRGCNLPPARLPRSL